MVVEGTLCFRVLVIILAVAEFSTYVKLFLFLKSDIEIICAFRFLEA